MIIIPAGNSKVSWKAGSKLTKTAQFESNMDDNSDADANVDTNVEEVEEKDELFDAAKDFAASSCPEGVKEAIETVEVALDTAKQAIEEVEKNLGVEQGEKEIELSVSNSPEASGVEVELVPEEVEIETNDEKPEAKEVSEVEIEVGDDEDKKTEDKEDTAKKEEIVVKSEDKVEDKKEDGEKECNACMATAATEEEFCRFAKLSNSNRKKLRDYFVNMLQYPKDYVDLLVK